MVKIDLIFLMCSVFLFFAFPQEYSVRGKAKTIRRSSWKKKAPRRQHKEGVLLPSRTSSALGVSHFDSSRRKARIEEAAYGKVSLKEYSAREKALTASLERIHSCQRTILQLQLAGGAYPKVEKALDLLRRENKSLLPTLHQIKEFPCRFILDNPKEIVRESRRLNPGVKRNDLQHLLGMQIRQKHLLKTHIENGIRARRSFR